MNKDKIFKIIFTVISLIVIVGSFVGLYFLYENTYGKDDKQPPKVTITRGTE